MNICQARNVYVCNGAGQGRVDENIGGRLMVAGMAMGETVLEGWFGLDIGAGVLRMGLGIYLVIGLGIW